MKRAFVWVSLFVGTAARVLPLLDPEGRALRQFASEDGYLMLTIARNLAIGNGLSIEDGTTLTNGTQPLMTFVYAGIFWLVGGGKVWGVVLVQALGVAIALLCAYLLYRVGLLLLEGERHAAALSGIAAAAWYIAPAGARYTQNCLETGAATLLPMAVGLFFLRHSPGPAAPWSLSRCASLGALLGIAFWVRNDEVLLCGAVCLTLLFSGARGGSVTPLRRVIQAGCVGLTALVVVSPWLAFNYSLFGHLVPVSGISQGAHATFGQNLARLPSILAEQVSVVALIPLRWEARPTILALASILVVAWAAGVCRLSKRFGLVQRQWLAAWSVWSLFLLGFYGAVYGAGYFMGRYLFPLSPWVALLSVALVRRVWVSMGARRPRLSLAVALAFAVLMSIGLDLRARQRGMDNGHFQVVEWVNEHVAETEWIGAIQSGTLGYFHDRTYNLDGKVSPSALQARLEGGIFDYVIERPTRYLVDWVGIESWLDDERLAQHFELMLLDESRNLVVLRRTSPWNETAN